MASRPDVGSSRKRRLGTLRSCRATHSRRFCRGRGGGGEFDITVRFLLNRGEDCTINIGDASAEGGGEGSSILQNVFS